MGQPFMWDFANLFRWWLNRFWENELSARINLVSPEEYKKKNKINRYSSEEFTIKLRPKLKKFLLKKYPDIKIRLLEDPPGPPVRATFLIKIKSDASIENVNKFREIVEKEVHKIAYKQKLVDVLNSKTTPKRKITIKIDNESLSLAGLTTKQVAYTLWISLNWIPINLIKNNHSLEATNIILTTLDEQNTKLNILKKITFTNPQWQKIPLESIATLKYDFVSNQIYTDKREESQYIYWEMWDNSLIYPVIELFWKFMDKNFWTEEKLVKNPKTKKEEKINEQNYKLVSWNPYELKYIWIKDWKHYKIEWGGEWELTMDTFRDLWLAMWLSLLAIYFLLVGQFASFRISGIIMITFLLWFFGVFPWFTILYLLKNEYFSATSMIWVIALAWIVVWNAIILIDYLNVLKRNWLTIKDALLKAGYVRFAPIILTSLTTVFWAATIIWDPVWSGLAWTIIWWLFISSILTLIVIPIFYYDSQKNNWEKEIKRV
jgi:multidrug efflux pump subunit AcrB